MSGATDWPAVSCPGDIVLCDFDGFKPPEMVKRRSVVILTPHARTDGLVTVVPLSANRPNYIRPWHWEVPAGVFPANHGPIWVKCDMLQTVATRRLSRDGRGRFAFLPLRLDAADLRAVMMAVLSALPCDMIDAAAGASDGAPT